ncbi:2-succinyl-5-enolpyruvyl-6-hydroxy-3-cyclohexene-1-carboxylic-acid synthase [Naumannella sp. ID2617S]|nr:2-succinyl-5-enolpyruvyl-6-hydroxy-3-cyclohexene-1-carboxylic-acid synthase [Naumannella sp. ID2617S]
MQHLVLCPGSRSAPLALAATEAASLGRVELHVRVDERSAGFLALGLAKATGVPVAVITTSGTAVGNLMPAVMEASHSGVGLVVLSADRPESLLHTGANQATDQVGMFGSFVRAESRISGAAGNSAAWSHQVVRLWAAATGIRSRRPGPVQLNLALSVPLIAEDSPWPAVVSRSVAELPVKVVAEPLDGRRTVLLVGDCPPEEGRGALELGARHGIPVLSEPSGNARSGAAIRCYRLLLESPLGQKIERVVVVGHPTLSRPVTRLLGRTDVDIVVVTAAADWHDPGLAVDRVVSAVDPADQDPAWLAGWHEADTRVSQGLDALLGDRLTGPSVASMVVASIGESGVLVVGSSNPIRDLDLAPVPEQGPVVHANRGLAGIDGTVSTAVGIAVGLGRPVTALMGDLTFLHDVGGLLVGPLEQRPRMRVVAVNDDGGSIFHTLEQGAPAYADSFERVFGTPTGVRLQPVVEGYGWAYRRAETLSELRSLLAQECAGLEVIEVPVSRDDRRELDHQIRGLAQET